MILVVLALAMVVICLAGGGDVDLFDSINYGSPTHFPWGY